MKTIFINDDLHKLLKLKAISESHSLGEIIDSVLRRGLAPQGEQGTQAVWLKLKGVLKGDNKIDEAMEELSKSWSSWKHSA